MRQLKADRSDRCQSVASPRKHYCIGFYDKFKQSCLCQLSSKLHGLMVVMQLSSQAKHVIMCKPAMQNNTVSFYVLETAQHYLGRRLQGCSFLRICLNICSNNLPAIDREDLD